MNWKRRHRYPLGHNDSLETGDCQITAYVKIIGRIRSGHNGCSACMKRAARMVASPTTRAARRQPANCFLDIDDPVERELIAGPWPMEAEVKKVPNDKNWLSVSPGSQSGSAVRTDQTFKRTKLKIAEAAQWRNGSRPAATSTMPFSRSWAARSCGGAGCEAAHRTAGCRAVPWSTSVRLLPTCFRAASKRSRWMG
jgi:hypothetical protein